MSLRSGNKKPNTVGKQDGGTRYDKPTLDTDANINISMAGKLELPKQQRIENEHVPKPIDVKAMQRTNFSEVRNSIDRNQKRIEQPKQEPIPRESGSINADTDTLNKTPIAKGTIEMERMNTNDEHVEAVKMRTTNYMTNQIANAPMGIDEVYLTNDVRPIGINNNKDIENIESTAYTSLIKHDVMYQGMNQIEREQLSLNDLNTYLPKVGYMAMFDYENIHLITYHKQNLSGNGYDDWAFETSRKFIPPGTGLLYRKFNTTFLERFGITHIEGLPNVTNMIAHGLNQASPNDSAKITTQSLLAGRILFCLKLMNFKDLMYVDSTIAQMQNATFVEPYQDMFYDTVINIANVSIVKAAYRNIQVKWFDQEVSELIRGNEVTYRNGKVNQQNNSRSYKMYSTYAADSIDQYTASLLNYNAKEFLASDNTTTYFENLIKANSLPNAKVNIDQGLNLDRVDIEDKEQRLRNIVYCICMNNSIYRHFEQGALQILNDYNIITSRPKPLNITPEQCDAMTLTAINRAHKKIESTMDNVFEIQKLLTMEVVPPLRFLTMTIPSDKFDPYEFILRLITIVYASEYLPNTFMRTIGFTQNWFLKSLHSLQNGVSEFSSLINRYGYMYRKNMETGNIETSRLNREWTNNLYLDRWLPIFHGLVYFPEHFEIRDLKLISQFVSLCRNITGIWREDSRGKLVYPRVLTTPEHFYPCEFSVNKAIDVGLNSAFNVKRITVLLIFNAIETGVASKNTIKNNVRAMINHLLGEYTWDNNFGMHTQGILTLDIIGNGPYAIFSSRPRDLYEIPYEQLCAKTVNENNRIHVLGDGKYDIEANVDFSIFWDFFSNKTFTLTIEDDNQIQRGTTIPIILETRIESVIDHIKYSENMFRLIREMAEIRGLVSWLASGNLFYEAKSYQHINDQGETVSSISVIDKNLFYIKLHSLMSDMGLLSNDENLKILTIQANTTVDDLNAYLEVETNPRIVIINAIGSDVIRERLIDQKILLFGDTFETVTSQWPAGYFEEPIVISEHYSKLIPFEFHNYDLKSRLDSENVTKFYSSSLFRKLASSLMRSQDIDPSGEGTTTFWNSIALQSDFTLGLTFIRRTEGSNSLPYREGLDNPAFKSSKFFISKKSSDRLEIVLKALNNKVYKNIQKGIVFGHQITNDTFDHLLPFDKTDYIVMPYSPDLIGPVPYVEKRLRRYGILIDGVYKTWDQIDKKIYFKINQETLNADELATILNGYQKEKAAVEISDLNYTYEVTNEAPDTVELKDVLQYNSSTKNLVYQFKFYDTVGFPANTIDQPIRHYDLYKTIFPVTQLDKPIAIRSLISNRNLEKPTSAITNFKHDIDTGPAILMGEDLKYTDNTLKLENEEALSFTNHLHCFTKNLTDNSTINFSLIDMTIDENTTFN